MGSEKRGHALLTNAVDKRARRSAEEREFILEKEDREELKSLIPSSYVRKYVQDKGITFIDFQKCCRFSDLAKNTADQKLQKQITEYLGNMESGFESFKENGRKSHIYILKVQEEDMPYEEMQPYGYFYDWKTALDCGKKENFPFEIEKHPVMDRENMDEFAGKVCYAYESGWISFGVDGKTINFWCREMDYAGGGLDGNEKNCLPY
ncbi:MAG: hypothetical protein OSJ44_15220 [Lachnospiraceae bacterium]|nr:hypothetical protein [Lachnospiraceae bacterium]